MFDRVKTAFCSLFVLGLLVKRLESETPLLVAPAFDWVRALCDVVEVCVPVDYLYRGAVHGAEHTSPYIPFTPPPPLDFWHFFDLRIDLNESDTRTFYSTRKIGLDWIESTRWPICQCWFLVDCFRPPITPSEFAPVTDRRFSFSSFCSTTTTTVISSLSSSFPFVWVAFLVFDDFSTCPSHRT